MTELTMAERDAKRVEGYYWVLTKWGADHRGGPVWQPALWDPTRRFYGAGWLEVGAEEDLPVNQVLDVDETRLVPPDAMPLGDSI